MPWCEDCQKYWAPSSMNPDGSCSQCGADLDEPPRASPVDSVSDDKTPWHFKLMIVAVVGYLGWRFVEIAVDIFT